MKILRNGTLLIFIVIFAIGVFFQIKVEVYKTNLIRNYNFNYSKKERLRYTPYIYFVLQSKLLKKNKCYFKNINNIYKMYEKNNIEREKNEEFYIPYNIEYNAYLLYCYYSFEELDCN